MAGHTLGIEMKAKAQRLAARVRAALFDHVVGLAVGLLGTLLLFNDLWGKDWSATLWGGKYDPRFLYWTFQWGHHALFERWDWLGYFNANIYYPTEASLAFADPVLSAMVLFSPLRWIGVQPLPAVYLTLMEIGRASCRERV